MSEVHRLESKKKKIVHLKWSNELPSFFAAKFFEIPASQSNSRAITAISQFNQTIKWLYKRQACQ